jgi:glycosyltransferase involved in cell wall biosynthesis
LSTGARDPLISVCVPTHHGRRDTLAVLLGGLIEQARDLGDLVEICVSDNASSDGTAELVGELSRKSACRLAYHRQPDNIGLARNLTAVVELARGRYCWLLGSDDRLAPGALARACELLAELPGATGYVVGAIHVDAANPTLRSRALPRAFHPPHDQSRLIEGVDRIYDECGNGWCALSWSIVDREAWLRASQRHARSMLAHPFVPHIVVLAAVAAERPSWGWLAEPLVHQRNATTFLFEKGEMSVADRWTEIIGGAAAVWASVLGGRGRARWRSRMRRLQEVWGSAADVRATKLYDRPRLRSQARLAVACLRAFWPVRDYWLSVLSASVMPVWMTRARYGVDESTRPRRGDVEAERVSISADLPGSVLTGGVEQVTAEVHNDGRRAILPDGARAVTLGQRWFTADGRQLGREELGLNELAFLPQTLPRSVRAGRGTRAALALYAPLTPGVYRIEVAAHQHGRGWLDEAGTSQALARDIKVVAARCATSAARAIPAMPSRGAARL